MKKAALGGLFIPSHLPPRSPLENQRRLTPHDHHVGRPPSEQPHAHHTRNLVDRRLQAHRVHDPRAADVQYPVAVVCR